MHTDIASLNGVLWGTETQANVLIPSPATLSDPGALRLGLRVEEDVRLLLKGALRLDGQLGRHGCKVSVDDDSLEVCRAGCFRERVVSLQEIDVVVVVFLSSSRSFFLCGLKLPNSMWETESRTNSFWD